MHNNNNNENNNNKHFFTVVLSLRRENLSGEEQYVARSHDIILQSLSLHKVQKSWLYIQINQSQTVHMCFASIAESWNIKWETTDRRKKWCLGTMLTVFTLAGNIWLVEFRLRSAFSGFNRRPGLPRTEAAWRRSRHWCCSSTPQQGSCQRHPSVSAVGLGPR